MSASINKKFFGPTDKAGPQIVLVGRIIGQLAGENCTILKQRAKHRYRVQGETSGAIGNVTLVDENDVANLNEGECFLLGLQRDLTTQRPIWALKQNTVTYYKARLDQEFNNYLDREIWFPTPPSEQHTTFFPADQVDGSEDPNGGNGGDGGNGGGNTPPGEVPPSGAPIDYPNAVSGAVGIFDTHSGIVTGTNNRVGGNDDGNLYTSIYVLGTGLDNSIAMSGTNTARPQNPGNPITLPINESTIRYVISSASNRQRRITLTEYNGLLDFNTDNKYTTQEMLNAWSGGLGVPYINTCSWLFDHMSVWIEAQDSHPTDPAPINGQLGLWGFDNTVGVPYLEGLVTTSTSTTTTNHSESAVRSTAASVIDSSARISVNFDNSVSNVIDPVTHANYLEIKESVENVEWHAGSISGTLSRATNLGTNLDLDDVSIGELLTSAGVDVASVVAGDHFQMAMYADSTLSEIDYKLCMTASIIIE